MQLNGGEWAKGIAEKLVKQAKVGTLLIKPDLGKYTTSCLEVHFLGDHSQYKNGAGLVTGRAA
jgi:hypothetical protein